MATTPATPITFTLANQSAYPMDIKNITYVDDSNIQHHSNYSNFAYGGSDNTSNSTLITSTKHYQTGDYLDKIFNYDTHPRPVHYSTHTGTQLNIENDVGFLTTGIGPGWVANSSDGSYDGTQSVVSVSSPTRIIMSDPPLNPNPIVGGTITFSTTTHKIEMNNTTGIYAEWKIIGNGYGTHATVLSVVGDGITLIVDVLPVNPQVGNPMLFTSSTNYLTLNDTGSLVAGWTADGNGYDSTQSILSVIDGFTVQMSGPPVSTPATGNPADQITFTNNIALVELGAGASTTFTINYVNLTSNVGVSYPSAITIDAIYNLIPVVGYINNFTSINSPPPPPPTYAPTGGGGGGGGHGGGGGYTAPSSGGVQGGWGAGGTDGAGGMSSTGGVSATA
jgi:hypothetical protein